MNSLKIYTQDNLVIAELINDKFNILVKEIGLETEEEANKFYLTEKENYGVEDINFLDPLEFISFQLHSVQQGQCHLYINGKECYAKHIKDTSGKGCSLSTIIVLDGEEIELKYL